MFYIFIGDDDVISVAKQLTQTFSALGGVGWNVGRGTGVGIGAAPPANEHLPFDLILSSHEAQYHTCKQGSSQSCSARGLRREFGFYRPRRIFLEFLYFPLAPGVFLA